MSIIPAIVIPLGFLSLVYRLDLTNNAFLTNTDIGFITVLTFVAPIVEEIFKSLSLVCFVRRPEFT